MESQSSLSFVDRQANIVWDIILRRKLELRSSPFLSFKGQLKLIKDRLRSGKKKGLRNLGSRSVKISLTLLREAPTVARHNH